MALHTQTDIQLLNEKWEEINREVEKHKLETLEPTLDEMREVHKFILDFVKTSKRKLYGGFALNMLVESQNPNDVIYIKDHVPDIDFYSPEPIVDLIKICNLLHKKGFKHVVGKEAIHQETYSIYANYIETPYCYISYVPKNIYNKMPFIEINGFMTIHPNFMTIDYLRMMNDPMTSYWRIGHDLKGFKRYVLLQKYYPLLTKSYPIDIGESNTALDEVLKNIFKFICDRKSIIVVGFYAYDYFLYASKLVESKKNKKFKYLQVPYFEIISTNYRQDCLDLMQLLKSGITYNKDDIKNHEYYPFFQFTDYSTDIDFGSDIVARIYSNNKKCIPYQDVPAVDFMLDSATILKNNKIRIGTFPLVLQYALVTAMKARTNGDDDTKQLYFTFVSHLTEIRNYYLSTNKKTFLDDTVFKEFVTNCIGDTVSSRRQFQMTIDSKKKKGQKYAFRYEPTDDLHEPECNYMFANSSGNLINNPRNLKLSEWRR